MSYVFECLSCGATTDPGERHAECPECGGRFEIAHAEVPGELPDSDRTDLWRYADFLPTEGIDLSAEGAPRASMGEGWTPLVEAPHLSETAAADLAADGLDVLLKNETVNPTWSWKDRLAALVVPRAVAQGTDRIATASTGNHASAVAAYASRAGAERTLVFVHPSSEPPHHRQIRAYGAESLRLSDYGERKRLLRELFANGIVSDRPKMVSAESEERHPLAAAHESDAESVGRDDGPEPLSTSTMGSISGDHALGAVRASGGAAYAADRESVEAAIRTCGRDGVFLEPASALAPAVVSQAVAEGVVGEGDTVVAVGTGAGVAWPEKTAGAVGESPTVEPDLAAIDDAVPFDLE